MASTITAGNATNGLALSCDNTGILELKTGTGSGTTAVTIDASQNVTLPNAITLTGGVAGDFKMNSGYGSVATAYGCRAWVNFNGTGTVAIRASGNVSSITDNGGLGDYTVNFTTAMPDANYSVVGTAQGSTIGNTPFVFEISGSTNPATSSCRVQVQFANAGGGDRATVCVLFFR
jgi:hypothetical protein